MFLTLLFLPLYVCVFSGIMFSLHNLMHCDNCFCCVRDVNRVQFLGNVSLLAYQFCLLVPNVLQSAVLGMCAGESNWWRSLQYGYGHFIIFNCMNRQESNGKVETGEIQGREKKALCG